MENSFLMKTYYVENRLGAFGWVRLRGVPFKILAQSRSVYNKTEGYWIKKPDPKVEKMLSLHLDSAEELFAKHEAYSTGAVRFLTTLVNKEGHDFFV
jgi:hypothetical protein